MGCCKLTGKRFNTANKVSHANNKNKTKQNPNIQRKKIWFAEEGRFVRLQISTRALRSLNRMGLAAFAKKNGIDLNTIR